MELAQKIFPFLRLPAEIRNAIYCTLVNSHVECFENGRLRHQPAITRVNRQLRAEALPLYYRSISVLLVQTEYSRDWVPFVQRVVDAFNSGPGSSTLQYLEGLQLDFLARRSPGVHLEVDMVIDPDDLTICDRVRVGSPVLDWTDAAAVRAACDEAAIGLEDDLSERLLATEEDVELVPSSTMNDRRAALDTLCIFASACPQLTSVSICESSSILEVPSSVLDLMSYDDVLAMIIAEGEAMRDQEVIAEL
ncbi:hypothetical protein Daus18300_012868 [Diaporthe australafricana]|uniref:F-box domain-containing protein n=1 Tax=Diaporthe australafricana TaxID=127596 RepID=A0ABR3W1G3_9PEZI